MKKLLFTITLTAIALALYAGPDDSEAKSPSGFDAGRLVYGGQFGFGFGSDSYWSVYLSPQLGYRLTDRLTVGAGVSYAYAQEEVIFKSRQNQFGLNAYSDFFFSRQFFVSARPEVFFQRQSWRYVDDQGNRRKLTENNVIPALVLGVGVYFNPVFISVSYDVVQHDLTPYGDSMFLSVGFRF